MLSAGASARVGMRIELWFLCVVTLLALMVGLVLGYPWQALLLASIFYIVRLFSNLYRFLQWVNAGFPDTDNMGKGIWQVLSQSIDRQRKRQINAVKNMRESVSRFSQLSHAINEGMLILSADYRLDWWNTAAGELLNLEESDRGHSLTGLIRDPAFSEYLDQETFEATIELPSRTQSNRTLLFRASRFATDEIVLVISDITQLKNMENLRKEFVGNVSHDLRTPITVLRGYLETLGDIFSLDNPVVEKACTQMSEQVMRMQALADDLIVLSRLEAQPEEEPLEKIELNDLLRLILNEAEVVSAGKHKLSLECPQNICVMAQQINLHSAIGNLVINAVRHNPEGAQITVWAKENEAGIEIGVRDNGVGISAEALPRLTERFYRTDSSRSSTVGGTGLGLAIVKHIVNRYGGSLLITSKLGAGAEFIIHLPGKA